MVQVLSFSQFLEEEGEKPLLSRSHKESAAESSLFFFNFYLFIFLAALGLRFCTQLSLVVASRGYSLAVVQRLLTVVASPVAEHGLNCSKAHGIFLDWLSNLCPLHWQADS